MLKKIIRAINVYVGNHDRENQQDFMRNMFANLISWTILGG